MAGPVNGIGGQQQIPLSQQSTQQSNPNNESLERARESDPQENTSQSRDAAASQSQENQSESPDENLLRQLLAEALEGEDDQQGSNARRGSLVDVSV